MISAAVPAVFSLSKREDGGDDCFASIYINPSSGSACNDGRDTQRRAQFPSGCRKADSETSKPSSALRPMGECNNQDLRPLGAFGQYLAWVFMNKLSNNSCFYSVPCLASSEELWRKYPGGINVQERQLLQPLACECVVRTSSAPPLAESRGGSTGL